MGDAMSRDCYNCYYMNHSVGHPCGSCLGHEKHKFPEEVDPNLNSSFQDKLEAALKNSEKDSGLDKLINDHWNYIESLLNQTILWDEVEMTKEEYVSAMGFHYKTAFRHGWKHREEHRIESNGR